MTTRAQELRADATLAFTAMIWGSSFVAQRLVSPEMGSLTFNTLRFALGAVVLLVPILITARHAPVARVKRWRLRVPSGMLAAGVLLAAGSELQQRGLATTTAGKAGFLTTLYVVIVPLLAFVCGRAPQLWACLGALLALAGAYLLSVQGAFAIASGDVMVILSAVLWSVHFLLLGRMTKAYSGLHIAAAQFIVCALISAVGAAATETINPSRWASVALPVIYAGVVSVGVGYTLQVIAQRHAPPTHAAIIASLEAVFAAIAGFLWLGENLTTRGLIGCGLMLSGAVLAQLRGSRLPSPTA